MYVHDDSGVQIWMDVLTVKGKKIYHALYHQLLTTWRLLGTVVNYVYVLFLYLEDYWLRGGGGGRGAF